MHAQESNKKILVIIAGGTIDALYSPADGTPHNVPMPATPEESAIPEALERLGVADQCDVFAVSMEDSKDVTERHLREMADRIQKGGYEKVVIVHGTDMMPSNGRYLDLALKAAGPMQTKVIFTGAMRPLRDAHKNWHDENGLEANRPDGLENMRRAFADARDEAIGPGVYLQMGEGYKNVWDVEKVVFTEEQEVLPGKRVHYVTKSGFDEVATPLNAHTEVNSFWKRQEARKAARATERSGGAAVLS